MTKRGGFGGEGFGGTALFGLLGPALTLPSPGVPGEGVARAHAGSTRLNAAQLDNARHARRIRTATPWLGHSLRGLGLGARKGKRTEADRGLNRFGPPGVRVVPRTDISSVNGGAVGSTDHAPVSSPALLRTSRVRTRPQTTTRWCNGSTADFGSACPGSNPGRVAWSLPIADFQFAI